MVPAKPWAIVIAGWGPSSSGRNSQAPEFNGPFYGNPHIELQSHFQAPREQALVTGKKSTRFNVGGRLGRRDSSRRDHTKRLIDTGPQSDHNCRMTGRLVRMTGRLVLVKRV